MKINLFFIAFLAIIFSLNAQMSENGDGFVIDNTNRASNCIIDIGLPNDNSLMNYTNQSGFEIVQLTSNGLVLTSKSEIGTTGIPAWFQIRSIFDGGTSTLDDDICSPLDLLDIGVNLTNQAKFAIKVASSLASSKLEIFLASGHELDFTDFQFLPTSSTYSSNIIASIDIKQANKFDTYVVDFATLDATKWNNFEGKNKVQSIGYRSATSNAIFTIEKVLIGSESPAVSTINVVAKSFSVYPNPASDVLTVEVDAVAASSVELVDLSGKLVATQSVGAGFNKVQFNVANVNAGLYFLSVRSANGVVTKKVIVK